MRPMLRPGVWCDACTFEARSTVNDDGFESPYAPKTLNTAVLHVFLIVASKNTVFTVFFAHSIYSMAVSLRLKTA